MSEFASDRQILRQLAASYAEIAASDEQNTNIDAWRALYAKKPVKPMFSISQICWEELENEEELVLRCEDPFARELEDKMRKMLYRHKYFPCDMVFTPYIGISKLVYNSGIGVGTVTRDNAPSDANHSHVYSDGIPDEAALERLHYPIIEYKKAESEARLEKAMEYFGDILPVRLTGSLMWMALWDRIVFWRGAEKVLYELADRPEFLHKLMQKLTDIEHYTIDKYEELNLFEAEGALCHCAETWCEDLPKEGYDPKHVRAKDCWVSGAAQIFSEVSPRMHDEFEIEYMKPLYERFGLVNYGCCEPLHKKIDIIRKINNIRMISASPWTDVDRQAEAMGADFVMARKPNPAFVAFDTMDTQAIANEIRHTLNAAKRSGTPVLFVLKDITTLRNHPERLKIWHDTVKKEIDNF